MPDAISYELGASLGIPALTAHRCLYVDGPPKPGERVLVAGGAGAVGHFAIELARRAGAAVVSTASSPDKARLARAAGAQAVVSYRDSDAAAQIAAAAGGPISRVIEVAPAANLALDLGVLGGAGSIVSYASDGDGELSTSIRPLMIANVSLRFVFIYTVPAADLEHAVNDVSAALRAGALSALPTHRFSLDEIVAAHEAAESGLAGKVIVAL